MARVNKNKWREKGFYKNKRREKGSQVRRNLVEGSSLRIHGGYQAEQATGTAPWPNNYQVIGKI